MELLESNDLKNELIRKSAKHRQELEEEVKTISAKTEKIVTNALIIGGALALTYFTVRQFSGSKKKKKIKSRKVKVIREDQGSPEEEDIVVESGAPGIVSQIGAALASQATIFLLTLAKEKLSEYLESQSTKKPSE
jgi:hypothetical protein